MKKLSLENFCNDAVKNLKKKILCLAEIAK